MSYKKLIIADGPSLYWPLNATDGATDQSSNGRHGAAASGISIGAFADVPIIGETSVTDFSGGQWVSATYSPFVNGTSRTFTGWAARDTATGFNALIGGGGSGPPFLGPGPIIATSYDVAWLPNNGVAAAYGTWADIWPHTPAWVHWAFIFNETANTAEFFINGVSQTQKTGVTDPYGADPGPLSLGINAYGNPWDGRMGHFAVFERALTASEIRSHYMEGVTQSNADTHTGKLRVSS